jgi:GNAT superfamily N-acetyltransferase
MILSRRGDYGVTADRARLDLDVIHGFLTTSYWAAGITRETIVRSLEHSLPFGLLHEPTGALVGFARVITDRTTFGYLADVFVLEAHRGRGLGTWLVGVILEQPELQGFRRWLLVTRDAHAIYAANGFRPLPNPESFMIRQSAAPVR